MTRILEAGTIRSSNEWEKSDGPPQKLTFQKHPYQFQERSASGAMVSSSTFYRRQGLLQPLTPASSHLHTLTLQAKRKSKDARLKQWDQMAPRGAQRCAPWKGAVQRRSDPGGTHRSSAVRPTPRRLDNFACLSTPTPVLGKRSKEMKVSNVNSQILVNPERRV